MRWPVWWDWDLELTPPVLKRMLDREFTEVDLRQMLEDASSLKRDVEEAMDRHFTSPPQGVGDRREPAEAEHVLVVITAYPVVRKRS